MLGVALGTFAASYADTVDRSFEERIRYDAGVDLRGSFQVDPIASTPGVASARVEELPGVIDASAVVRDSFQAGRSTGALRPAQLLALEPGAAAEMLWFREDFAGLPLATLMELIDRPPTGRGRTIPDGTQTLRFAVDVEPGESEHSLWARFRAGDGRFFTIGLGDLPQRAGRQALEIDFADEIGDSRLQAPYSFHGVVVSGQPNVSLAEPPVVRFEQILAIQADGRETVVEEFDTPGWERARVAGDARDEVELVAITDGVGDDSALEFRLGPGRTTGLRAFYLRDPGVCAGGSCRVPAIVSSLFLQTQRLEVGDRFLFRLAGLTIPAIVAGEASLFPTLNPEVPFVIADLDVIFHLTSVASTRVTVVPTSMWMRAADDPEVRAELISDLGRSPFVMQGISDLPQRLADERADPLTTAGGSGILLVAFVAIAILLGLAFLVTLAVAARRRTLEMAVLRTLGIGRRTILGQLLLEYAIISVIGVLLGIVLGTQITGLLLSYLEVTERGLPVVPPFIVETDWRILTITLGLLGGVILLGVIGTWRYFVRLALSRELRLTA